MYFFHLEDWAGFLVGLLALMAARYGGEHFIMRQLRVLLTATARLANGDLTSRTGVTDTKSELGQLAHTFDTMAESLEQRAREREESENFLLNRAQQQAVVAALGQFAMVSQDFSALLNRGSATRLADVGSPDRTRLELQPDGETLIFRAGLGWRAGRLSTNIIEARGRSSRLRSGSGDPVVIADLRRNRASLLPIFARSRRRQRRLSSSSPRDRPYGMLGVYTVKPRKFTGEEVQFLLAVANCIGMSAERRRTEAELHKLAAFAQQSQSRHGTHGGREHHLLQRHRAQTGALDQPESSARHPAR